LLGGWFGDRANRRDIADAGECSAKLAVVIVISGVGLADFFVFYEMGFAATYESAGWRR
jgi:hypothetical protein